MTAGDSLTVHRGADRFTTRAVGLTSWHAFSFGEHYDPTSVAFGRLLVSNEDVVGPGHGYDQHPHRNSEIVTWVLSGSLVHTDSYGNTGLVYPGLAQRMSAGSGIVHSERNDAYRIDPGRPPEPAHFVQMWLAPDQPDTTPGYAQRELTLTDLDRDWVPIASADHPDAAIDIAARGCTLWATRLAPGVRRRVPVGPLVRLQLCRGTVELETAGRLDAGDAAQITGREGLTVTGIADAELLVWVLDR